MLWIKVLKNDAICLVDKFQIGNVPIRIPPFVFSLIKSIGILNSSFFQRIMEWISSITYIVVSSVAIYYLYSKWTFTYWKRRGVSYIEPEFLWGSVKKMFKGELAIADQFQQIYQELKSRGLCGGGIYISNRPVFIPVDMDVIKSIFQKDFKHFVNHGLYCNEKDDPLQAHLSNLENERWRTLRAKLSSTFTSGNCYSLSHRFNFCHIYSCYYTG